ncbi:MAG: hypothetical protein KatS3mg068_0690 [Candidatus Sericytochromatia bacterium]|nr:MAG: hypothetical protein KatS3mg068_0690 [Candidatus Sericytochromatia bacterium]
MKILLIILSSIIAFLYWLGLSINHLVILSCFFLAIFLGALVIADNDNKEENT